MLSYILSILGKVCKIIRLFVRGITLKISFNNNPPTASVQPPYPYIRALVSFRSNTLTYNLRDSDGMLAIPPPRTNYCKRSLSYSEVVLWNSLPLNIRKSLSLNEFESKLKNHDFDSSLI